MKLDYQKQFDAEQQLNYQNTSGSGQLTDVQVRARVVQKNERAGVGFMLSCEVVFGVRRWLLW